MARKITILERLEYPGGWKATVCYWADVPTAAQSYYANPSAGIEMPGMIDVAKRLVTEVPQ